MFHRLREPFGKAGLIVAALALVFAMIGGAYAADNSGDGATASAKKKNKKGKQGGLNAKQKRQVIALAKRFAGKAGPQGPQGVPGLPGALGADGQNGSNGSNGSDGLNGTPGANGKSVTVTEIPTGLPAACEERGGAEVAEEGAGSGIEICNGEEGSPWTAGGTLPSGETLTGAWTLGTISEGALPSGSSGAGTDSIYVPISFPIPLTANLSAANVHYINPAGKELTIGEAGLEEKTPVSCGSGLGAGVNAENPQAAAGGHLCVYAAKAAQLSAELPPIVYRAGSASASAFGASKAGARLRFVGLQANAVAWGTWAVTAP